MAKLFDFAVMTIFCREVLEASVIIINYRTLIFRCETWPPGLEKKDALRAINVAAIVASLVAIAIITIVAIPLGILSSSFDNRVSLIIEGVSKIVAALCILQLSLKMPKWLGVYASKKEEGSMDISSGLTLRSIRFNVAWNIWREVAECGVFLLPFFLTGENLKAIPLSAIVGTVIGLLCGMGIQYANKVLKNKVWLAAFTSTLLLFLSTGLFSGGCGNIEKATTSTKQVWEIPGDFWSTDRLPMTILKPFGYSASRTVLQMVCFWSFFALGIALHVQKYFQSKRIRAEQAEAERDNKDESSQQFTDPLEEDMVDDTPAADIPDDVDLEAQDMDKNEDDKAVFAKQDSLSSHVAPSSQGEESGDENGVEIEAPP